MINRDNFYVKFIKRPQDFLLSIIALILLSPIIVLIAILIKIKLGSPVIFTQWRPGQNEKLFKLYKFRTMTNEKDKDGELLDDSARLTKFGIFLRSTSLDELPELINIIKGDMAIVGPRPLLVEYLKIYNSFQRRRHEVRPGLTGNAQINGRNSISWNDRFKLDIEYIDTISFTQDWKIIFKTFKKVFQREGISSKNSSTMELFTEFSEKHEK